MVGVAVVGLKLGLAVVVGLKLGLAVVGLLVGLVVGDYALM